ncbi:YeeE/YedE family protein [Deinococcus cavernae]|uniref:YeeE/YedE family protein n=1 Tax=Deinococcus cavernae TaxID=2320857 RepID=UPI001F3955D8|nr:YeeE/YedE family protein [Deinococcus cavernae]
MTRSSAAAQTPALSGTRAVTGLLVYLLVGVYFGVVLVKSEAASWYRLQEMFRFQSFHMYGLLGSAIATGLVTTALLRRYGHTRDGQALHIPQKEKGWKRYVLGGICFGLGWGLTGLCPGPIFILLGAGIWPILIVFLFALIGTYLYGVLQPRLPH